VGTISYDQRGTPGWPVRLNPQPDFLVGRAELLKRLRRSLAGTRRRRGPQTVALSGLGGVGKTSLAVVYGHQRLGRGWLVWQFPAGTAAALMASFAALASQLGVRHFLDASDPVAAVHRALTAVPAKWLLIFDNAPDPASIQAFLPPGGNGQVIITSQNASWPVPTIEVPPLEADVAGGFLLARAKSNEQAAAHDLAEELGGLPLALEQACAYMVTSGLSIADYLRQFRVRHAELLARGEPADHCDNVATTFSLAFGLLQQAAPEAIALLCLTASCSSDAIPLLLLLGPLPQVADILSPPVRSALTPLSGDVLRIYDAVMALRRYSLSGPLTAGSLSVHRLVQVTALSQLADEERDLWGQATATLVAAALPLDPQDPESWPAFAALLHHGLTVLPAGSAALAQLVSWIGEAGDPASARDRLAELLPAMERVLGAEHPATLTARANLARWTGEAGDRTAARDQLALLAPVQQRSSGPEHPATLAVRADLARWTGETGDPVTARDQLAALLPVRERISGPRHIDTLRLRQQLASWTGEAGDAIGARDQCAALLPVMADALGPEHPRTLTVRHNLASWIADTGDVTGARDTYAELLPIRERVLGETHPDSLDCRHQLGQYTGLAGDAASARDQFAELVTLREKGFGAEHPSTLIARLNLARWTGDDGHPADARDQLTGLLPVLEHVLGADHPYALNAQEHLARMTGAAGDPVRAGERLTALLPICERVLGPDHPRAASVRDALADLAEVAPS
jgi:hypothetical protein